MPKTRGDVEMLMLCFLIEFTLPYSLNAQRGWHTSEIQKLLHCGIPNAYRIRSIHYSYIQGVTGGTDQTSGGCFLC